MAYHIGITRASAERAWAESRGHYTNYRVLSPDVAHALRAARLREGVSLRQAARLVGINEGYLSRLERGLRAPRRKVAERLVRAYGLDEEAAEALLEEAAPESHRFRR